MKTLTTLGLTILAGCHTASPPATDQVPADVTWTSSGDIVESLPHVSRARQAAACGTMRDVEEADALKVPQGGDGIVLFASDSVGLFVIDASNADDPELLATSPFTGTVLGVFERDGVAFVVFSPWDHPPTTTVRAVSIARRTAGRSLGEISLAGAPRDAWRVGESIVVTREVPPEPSQTRSSTIITTFGLDERGLTQRAALTLAGGSAVAAPSPWGIAVARESSVPERTAVTWIGMAESEGALQENGTAEFSGVVPRWRRANDHAIDVTEDGIVRIAACAASSCTPGEDGAYAAIDFAEPARPRVTAWSLIPRAADGVFAFTANRFLFARPPKDDSDSTELGVYRTDGDLVALGGLRLSGTVASIRVRGPDAVTLGFTGIESSGRRATVHHLDIRRTPKLIGSASFGGDWTWSPAFDNERAISFDPASTMAALPMTTMRDQTGAYTAVQVLSFSAKGPRTVFERETGLMERVLFVDGRLLAFSPEGVTVITSQNGERLRRNVALRPLEH